MKTNYIGKIKFRKLDNAGSQIRVMPIKSINTAKCCNCDVDLMSIQRNASLSTVMN